MIFGNQIVKKSSPSSSQIVEWKVSSATFYWGPEEEGGGSWNQIIFLHLIPVTFLFLYCYYLWKLQNKSSLYSRRISVPFRGIASIWEELFLNCDVLQGSQLRGSKINLHFTPIIYVWRVMNRFNTYLKIQETISVWIKYSEDMSTESFSVARWKDLTEQLE